MHFILRVLFVIFPSYCSCCYYCYSFLYMQCVITFGWLFISIENTVLHLFFLLAITHFCKSFDSLWVVRTLSGASCFSFLLALSFEFPLFMHAPFCSVWSYRLIVFPYLVSCSCCSILSTCLLGDVTALPIPSVGPV